MKTAPFFGKKLWLFVCLVVFLAGCGAEMGSSSKAGSPTPPAESYGGGNQPAGYPSGGAPGVMADSPAPMSASPQAGMAPQSVSKSAQPAPPPPSPTSSPRSSTASADAPSARRSAEATTPAPDSRPGLGTEFGEARTSRVHDVSFLRDAGRPFAVAALNYNDRKGVDALASVAARRDSARSVAAGGGAVTISVRDANGDPLEAVHVGERTFVVGQAGQRYSIVLQNHTSHRFEAVGTVDGLDVINGKPGTFDNRGYVLMPFATLEIEGFRTSTSAVAAFRFASVADSYAAQTGSARNVGVIGIAFFTEKGDAFVPESETRLRDTASPFPADPRFSQPPARR